MNVHEFSGTARSMQTAEAECRLRLLVAGRLCLPKMLF